MLVTVHRLREPRISSSKTQRTILLPTWRMRCANSTLSCARRIKSSKSLKKKYKPTKVRV